MINFIKKGKDTSDATATANDILNPKTAYVNNEKITGNIQTTYGPIVTNCSLNFQKIFSIRDNRLITYNHTTKEFELYSYSNNSIQLLDTIDCSSISMMPTTYSAGSFIDISCEENNTRYACYTLNNRKSNADKNVPIVIIKIQNDKFINAIQRYLSVPLRYYSVYSIKVLFSNVHCNLFAALLNCSSDYIACSSIDDNLNITSTRYEITDIETTSEYNFMKWNSDDTALVICGSKKYVPFKVGINNSVLSSFSGLNGSLRKIQSYITIRNDFNYNLANVSNSNTEYEIYTCNNNISGNVLGINNSLVSTINLEGIPFIWENNNIVTIDVDNQMARLYAIDMDTYSIELKNVIQLETTNVNDWFSTVINSSYVLFKATSELVTLGQALEGVSIQSKEYIDTANATATASDLVVGKSAYINGQKVIGTIPTTNNITGSGSIQVSDESIKAGATISDNTYLYSNSTQKMIWVNLTESQVAEAIGLTSDKIVSGNTILDVVGTASIGTTPDTTIGNGDYGLETATSGEGDNDTGYKFFTNANIQSKLYETGSIVEMHITNELLAQAIGLTADKIKSGEVVCGIEGTYTGETSGVTE